MPASGRSCGARAAPAADAEGRVRNGAIVARPASAPGRASDGRAGAARAARVPDPPVLLDHPGRLVTRGRILRAVWGEAYQDEEHYIHVYISQLRRKLARPIPTAASRI